MALEVLGALDTWTWKIFVLRDHFTLPISLAPQVATCDESPFDFWVM